MTINKEYDAPMLGKHHSDDTKQRISESLKGRKKNPESVEKSRKSRMMDPEREQAIVSAYVNGDTITNILEKFNTSRGSVYRILDRNNIERHGAVNDRTNVPASEETKQKLSDIKTEYWRNKKEEIVIGSKEQSK